MAISTEGKRLRKFLEKNTAKLLGDKPRDVALYLSAGLDSTVAGLAATALGHRVYAYTFQLGDKTTFDSKWAKRTADIMGWDWKLFRLPTKTDNLLRHFDVLSSKYACAFKTDFECSWPIMLTAPFIEQKYVVSGLVVDGFFILSKSSILKGLAGPASKKIDYDKRREDYLGPICRIGPSALTTYYNPSSIRQFQMILAQSKKKDCNPWLFPNILDFFLEYDWLQLNKPRQKHFIAETYPEIEKIGHRNHVNYQLGASIPEHFEYFLKTPINFRGRRRTLDMYRDWRLYAREGAEVLSRLRKNDYKIPKPQTLF